MSKMRLASPPRAIEEEADRLLDEWAISDTPISFDEYLMRHASEDVKAYMKEIADISDEGE